MRKWIALGLAACMTVSSLTGCGSSQKETEAESTAAESVAEETTVEETTAEESEEAKSDLNKLVFTYVTSPLNVPTIIEKNQGIFAKDFGEMGITTDYAELTSGADSGAGIWRCAGSVRSWRNFRDPVCSKRRGYQGIKYVQPFSEGILHVF